MMQPSSRKCRPFPSFQSSGIRTQILKEVSGKRDHALIDHEDYIYMIILNPKPCFRETEEFIESDFELEKMWSGLLKYPPVSVTLAVTLQGEEYLGALAWKFKCYSSLKFLR
jgi:hypothetical protein